MKNPRRALNDPIRNIERSVSGPELCPFWICRHTARMRNPKTNVKIRPDQIRSASDTLGVIESNSVPPMMDAHMLIVSFMSVCSFFERAASFDARRRKDEAALSVFANIVKAF